MRRKAVATERNEMLQGWISYGLGYGFFYPQFVPWNISALRFTSVSVSVTATCLVFKFFMIFCAFHFLESVLQLVF
jgi:hypothetical protein